MAKKIYITLIVCVFTHISCEPNYKNDILNRLEKFYNNDFGALIEILDLESSTMLEVIISDTLNFNEGYQVSISSNIEHDNIIIIERENRKVHIYPKIKYKPLVINLTESDLIKLLSYEETTCISISQFMFEAKQFNRALKWLEFVDSDNIDHIYLLANIYYEQQKYDQAMLLFERLYRQGHEDAGIKLSNLLAINGDRQKAIEVLKYLADQGSTSAMVKLGEYYDTYFSGFGYEPPSDAGTTSAFMWYTKAAKLNNSTAMYQLGYIYEFGINRYPNLDSAFFWYSKAANNLDILAMAKTGEMYFEGKIVLRDTVKGWEYLNKVVIERPDIGCNVLGKIHEFGIGLSVNKEKALEYYKCALKAGALSAQKKIQRLEKIERKEVTL